MTKQLIIFSILIAFISCQKNEDENISDTISGNGDMEVNQFTIDGFYEVYAEDAYNLVFIQDSTWEIKVEAESNIMPYVETYTQNNTLIIENKDDIELETTKPITIEIHHRGLEKIAINGAANMVGNNVANHMHLSITGEANVMAEINCYELDVTISGVGVLNLSGEANESHITITGTGEIYADSLKMVKSWNTISGIGTEYLNVSNELHVDITGIGHVYYIGNPKVVSTITGMGSVERKP